MLSLARLSSSGVKGLVVRPAISCQRGFCGVHGGGALGEHLDAEWAGWS